MLRRRERPASSQPVIEAALCVNTFRPAPVAAMIQRGDRLPVDHWAVVAHPDFFVGIVLLVPREVSKDGQ
jgi:hypothetical protein